jgi:hypothetical protein
MPCECHPIAAACFGAFLSFGLMFAAVVVAAAGHRRGKARE